MPFANFDSLCLTGEIKFLLHFSPLQRLIDFYRHNVLIVSVHGENFFLLFFILFTEYRQWSNRVPLAYKLSFGCLIFWFLIFGHRLVLYTARNGSCSPLAGFYSNFDNYLEVVLVGMCPPIVTSVLAYLLIKSVRSVIHRQVNPANHLPQATLVPRTILQQMDAQLTLMLILQSIITMITYLPYAAELIYTNSTQYWPKSALRKAQDKVFVELIHILSYVFFASGFYVSMISNSGFRRQIKRILKRQRENESTLISPTGKRTGAALTDHTK